MTKKEIALSAVEALKKEYPDAKCSLDYETPLQLLVATRLSAQCTDARVNLVTPALLARFPDAESLAGAEVSEVAEYIKSCGLYKTKSKDLVAMAKMLVSDFGGEVPDTLEELTTLPGVGRKTANVILSVVWDRSAMAVDTHVFRVSHRIGLVPKRCTTPYSVEMELMKYLPHEVIPKAHHWLILHGRYVCTARSPKCDKCGLTAVCKENAKLKGES